MIKNKKQMFIVISVFTLVLLLGSVTYAFFNYTRTGASNTIRVGRISFVSRQTQTISLTNLFPIDPSETGVMDDDTKVGTLEIEIEGDTDYAQGVEYLISATDTNIYTSTDQVIPITLDFTVTGLGTSNANYFTERENKNANIYKKLVGDTLVGDQMLLVGYIKPNTTSGQIEGVNGSITIKAYLDQNKILISDTYDGTESDEMGTPNSVAEGRTVITTNEWNAQEMSFKVKVEANEGIWVNNTLDNIIRTKNLNNTTNEPIMDNAQSEFVSASTGIDFGAVSSSTNGQGVYMRAGTQNDAYPIVYYRGAVEDNNVLFNNKCWKAVRTTDTGGVKLIYNGEKQVITEYEHSDIISDSDITYTNDSAYPYTYDGTTKTWTSTMKTDNATGTITFSVNEVGNYLINYEVSSEAGYDKVKFSKNGTLLKEDSGTKSGVIDLGQLTTTDVIKVEYTKDSSSASGNDNVILSVANQTGSQTQTSSCDNTDVDTHINIAGTNMFAFNTSYNSPAYVGYMYGTVYPYSTSNWTSGAKFGSSFTWDGTNYKLVDATVMNPDATHHYSCNSTDADATCTDLRYVYYTYNNNATKYYITLTGGDGVEEALAKMNTNTNNSNAKTQIDSWYASNMNTVTNKLEDTIWCNDRSIGRYNGWSATSDYNNYSLLFGAFERSNYASGISIVKNQPSLVCANKNDAFTVNNGNGNGKLQYPVALLTEDEMVLAGGLAGSQSQFYLNNGSTSYWSLSPVNFNYNGSANEFFVNSPGVLNGAGANVAIGLRPVVSLKPGMPVVKGTGTVTDPYVIGN